MPRGSLRSKLSSYATPHKEVAVKANLKYKLIGALTAIAMFALPAAEAFAGRNWY
jgi:hypothetical protein